MNVLDIIRRHGIHVKRVAATHGGEYAGPCPGCGGEDRFRIWPEENDGKGSYWCRQCGRGGDGIQFLRYFEGMSFQEACRALGKERGDSSALRYRAPREERKETWRPKNSTEPEEAWRAHATKFWQWSYDRLHEDKEALTYLEGRGLTIDTILAFWLGWNPGDGKGGDVYRDRESWGLSPIKNEKGRKRPLWLPRGWVIPWAGTDNGVLKRLRIRRTDPLRFGPRYYVVPGSDMETMMLSGSRRTSSYIWTVVESELDAILIYQEAGDLTGVIALGSAGAKPTEEVAEALTEAAHIMIALDLDKAGAQYSPWWSKMFPRAVRWPAPEGKDPGEAWQKGVNIREWILAGLPAGLWR